jgi:hypothetical protein
MVQLVLPVQSALKVTPESKVIWAILVLRVFQVLPVLRGLKVQRVIPFLLVL